MSIRRLILALIVASPFAAPAGLAAPTCQDRNGLTIKCGTEGAMPVGWTLPPEEWLERQKFMPEPPSLNEMLELFCTLGVFFALMALMPDFEGRASEWDKQEDDVKPSGGDRRV